MWMWVPISFGTSIWTSHQLGWLIVLEHSFACIGLLATIDWLAYYAVDGLIRLFKS